MTKIELHAIAVGRVQGVFFRNNTRQIAQKLGLTGTIRNLRDGTVEIIAHGTREQLEEFIMRLKQNPGFARIDQLEPSYSTPHRKFDNFHIIK